MKNNTLRLFLILSLLFQGLNLNATHIMGGEITWKCQTNGTYVFEVRVYRDCQGVPLQGTGRLEIHNYPVVNQKTNYTLSYAGTTDISPACMSSPCNPNAAIYNSPGATQEYILRSAPIRLTGVPPAQGWTVTWSDFARNNSISNIINPGNVGMTLRATMYNYQGRSTTNCIDNSPDFYQKPSSIICAGERFTYNHASYDEELDSLVYEWANPLNGPSTKIVNGIFQEGINPPPVPFVTNFSFTNPFPNTIHDYRNVPASLNQHTGEITFTSFNSGIFLSGIRVKAYKCGTLVAEVVREIQLLIMQGCSPNEPPEIPPPFSNNTYFDTVRVGDIVDFNFSIYDTLRAGNPKNDTIFVDAIGNQFGQNFTSETTGCSNPPCATLSTPIPTKTLGTYTSRFRWQTDCNHITRTSGSCIASSNTYIFTIRAFDDGCPSAGMTVQTFSITVLSDSLVDHPNIYCADIQNNGDVSLKWDPGTNIGTSFDKWVIFSATNKTGPYTIIDSISNTNITTYTHQGANAQNVNRYYIVRAKSSCSDNWLALPADTISALNLRTSFNGHCVQLDWDPINTPLPPGSDSQYDIYREYPIGTGFNLYKTVSSSTYMLCDTFDVCTDSVAYKMELRNSNSCTSHSNTSGIRFIYPPTLGDVGNNIDVCYGDSTIIGGSNFDSTLTYTWHPDPTLFITSNILNPIVKTLDTATYYLTTVDKRGCIGTDSVHVFVKLFPQANAGNDTNICVSNLPITLYGSTTNSNTGSWIGGSGTFSPNRNTLTASYTPSAAELSIGHTKLSLVTTDNSACTPDTSHITINYKDFIANVTLNITPISCNNNSNAAAGVQINGTNGPYTVAWNTYPGTQNGDTISNLSAGNYSVTITNRFGCDSTINFTINNPTVITSSINILQNIDCHNNASGSIAVIANGGTSPYSYLWSNNATTSIISNLVAGQYSVTVTDAMGCVNTSSINIGQPSAMNISLNKQDVSCFGGSNGLATISVTGGTTPYTYLWNNNGTTNTINNLSAGNYSVVVTDANGCTINAQTTIIAPTKLQSTLSPTNISCFGANDGAIEVNPTGGTAPYNYQWSNNRTTKTINNLSAGLYTVIITDRNGCRDTNSYTIIEPSLLTLSMSPSDTICSGTSKQINANVQGGTSPYTYNWTPNVGNTASINVSPTSNQTYSLTVRDDNGCQATGNTSIIVDPIPLANAGADIDICIDDLPVSLNGNLTNSTTGTWIGGDGIYTPNRNTLNATYSPTATEIASGNLTLSLITTDNGVCKADTSNINIYFRKFTDNITLSIDSISCYNSADASASVSISGAYSPYSVSWDINSNIVNGNSINNLDTGSYSVTISNKFGCDSTLFFEIRNPLILNSTAAIFKEVSCKGDADAAVSVTAFGGKAPYTYQWSNNANTASINNISAGNYSVIVTDSALCKDTAHITVTEPDSLLSNITNFLHVSCYGATDGSATVDVSGGTLPYSYQWGHGDTTDFIDNLPTGNYSVIVTDSNGCVSNSSLTIIHSKRLHYNVIAKDISCFGFNDGEVKVEILDGVAPIQYQWSNNQTTDKITNLSKGTYTVSYEDVNGCTDTVSHIINEPDSLSIINITDTDTICSGSSKEIGIIAQGGILPYQYNWSNNAGNSDTIIISPQQSTNYIVTLSDSNGCIAIDSVPIIVDSIPQAIAGQDTNICIGDLPLTLYGTFINSSTGSWIGGSGTFNPNRQSVDAEYTPSQAELQAGSVMLSLITIDNGVCEADTSETTIYFRDFSATLNLNINEISCYGMDDASAYVDINGSNAPYSLVWNTPSGPLTTDSISDLLPGNYSVTISNRYGCDTTLTFDIIEPNKLTVIDSISNQILCNGDATGEIILDVSGGRTPYTYSWSNNRNTKDIDKLRAGNYTVIVTDSAYCTDTVSIELTEPDSLIVTVTDSDTICINSTKTLEAIVQGGTKPYTYNWSDNLGIDSFITVSPTTDITYRVAISDSNNCPTINKDIRIAVRDIASNRLKLTAPKSICKGDSVILETSFNGKHGPYTYTWNQNLNGIEKHLVSPTDTTDYILVIKDACNNSISDSITIAVNKIAEINLVDTTLEGCQDFLVDFNYFSSEDYKYRWEFGDGNVSGQMNPSHLYTEVGSYHVKLKITTAEGCISNSTQNYIVRVKPTPVAAIRAEPRNTTINNPEVLFSGDFFDATNWRWDLGEGTHKINENNFYIIYPDTGTFVSRLIKNNDEGCSDTAFLNINISPYYDLKLPTAFTPNKNGPNGGRYDKKNPNNEVFFPFVDFVKDYRFRIYNRWGKLIFESRDVAIGWDGYYNGELSASDVYIYTIEFTYINGTEVKHSGDITLLR